MTRYQRRMQKLILKGILLLVRQMVRDIEFRQSDVSRVTPTAKMRSFIREARDALEGKV